MGVRTFEIRTRQWTTTIPDSVKIVLLNETTEPLQQHLQLLSGSNLAYRQVKDTIIEYYRSKGGLPSPFWKITHVLIMARMDAGPQIWKTIRASFS